MTFKRKGREKGKAMEVSGIPLSGTISQVENPSVEPNRDEPRNAFREDSDTDESYTHDYIRDEEERLGNLAGGYVANKADETWSDGLRDEANEPDLFDGEGMFPEIQPLHVDMEDDQPGEEDTLDMVLRPDNIEQQPDDFTDIEIRNESRNESRSDKSGERKQRLNEPREDNGQ